MWTFLCLMLNEPSPAATYEEYNLQKDTGNEKECTERNENALIPKDPYNDHKERSYPATPVNSEKFASPSKSEVAMANHNSERKL